MSVRVFNFTSLVGVPSTGVRKILKLPLYADLPPLTPPKIGGEPIQTAFCLFVFAVSSPPFLGGAGGGCHTPSGLRLNNSKTSQSSEHLWRHRH